MASGISSRGTRTNLESLAAGPETARLRLCEAALARRSLAGPDPQPGAAIWPGLCGRHGDRACREPSSCPFSPHPGIRHPLCGDDDRAGVVGVGPREGHLHHTPPRSCGQDIRLPLARDLYGNEPRLARVPGSGTTCPSRLSRDRSGAVAITGSSPVAPRRQQSG